MIDLRDYNARTTSIYRFSRVIGAHTHAVHFLGSDGRLRLTSIHNCEAWIEDRQTQVETEVWFDRHQALEAFRTPWRVNREAGVPEAAGVASG